MSLPKLPLTIISGYLGAGKTSLINRLLAEDHGQRLLVMVNDFGAINIDADLLASADKDTLTLTNGCVCCTMGADLFMALGDALDRRPRPDHLIIEASGIADPAKIANAAIAEPELSYGGIVTLVGAAEFQALAGDVMIGPQIRAQVEQADLVLISKSTTPSAGLINLINSLTPAPCVLVSDLPDLAGLLLNTRPKPVFPSPGAGHPPYVSWSYLGSKQMTRDEIQSCLDTRPAGLFRLKGFIKDAGQSWQVHVVGSKAAVEKAPSRLVTEMVGIGLSARISKAEIEAWWNP